MRIQHVAQTVKGWPDGSEEDQREAVRLADAVEHVRWRLWHGQVERALDLIGETLAGLDAAAVVSSPSAVKAGKVAGSLRGLEKYVVGQATMIIDDATARHCEEPISRATTESTVQWLLHRRMGPTSRCDGRRKAHISCRGFGLRWQMALSIGTTSSPSAGHAVHSAESPHDPPGFGRSHPYFPHFPRTSRASANPVTDVGLIRCEAEALEHHSCACPPAKRATISEPRMMAP